MKKERADKAKQKMAGQEQSDIYNHGQTVHIEAVGNKKIEIFAEELHNILHEHRAEEVKAAKISKIAPPAVLEFEAFDPNVNIH
jgi:hypothetical protein